jgi:hypothetical protein
VFCPSKTPKNKKEKNLTHSSNLILEQHYTCFEYCFNLIQKVARQRLGPIHIALKLAVVLELDFLHDLVLEVQDASLIMYVYIMIIIQELQFRNMLGIQIYKNILQQYGFSGS